MANTVEIMELYTAYFNRAADKAGVDYWANEMDANGWTLDQVAQSFADQVEYQAIYGNLGNEGTIVAIYENLLNRAPDAAGLAYWKEQLDSGAIQIDNMVQAIINGAQGSDIAIIDNKTAVSQYAYDAGLEVTDGKTISLENITADPSTIDSIKTTIDGTVEAQNATGESFTLTTGPDVVEGKIGNDTITGTQDTYSRTADIITDESIYDNDTFNYKTVSSNTVDLKMQNIENINIDLVKSSSAAVTLTDVKHEGDGSKVTISSSNSSFNGNVTVTDAENKEIVAGAKVKVLTVNVKTPASDKVKIDAGSATKVTSDSTDVELKTNGDVELTTTTAAGKVVINAAANSTITLANAAATANPVSKLEIKGSGVTLKVKDADAIAAAEVIGAKTIIIADETTASPDLSKVKAEEIVIDYVAAAGTIKLAKDANITFTKAQANAVVVDGENATINAKEGFTSLQVDQNSKIKVDTKDITIGTLTGATDKTISFEGSKNVTITTTATVAVNIDASALSGKLNITTGAVLATNATDIVGSTGVNTIDVKAALGDVSVVTNAAADTVTVGAASGKDVAIELGAGNDTLILNAVVAATTFAADGGEGTDTIKLASGLNISTVDFTDVVGFEKLALGAATGSIVSAAQIEKFSFLDVAVASTILTVVAGSDTTLDLSALNVLNKANTTIDVTVAGFETIKASGTKDIFTFAKTYTDVVEISNFTKTGTNQDTIYLGADSKVFANVTAGTTAFDTKVLTALQTATGVSTLTADDIGSTSVKDGILTLTGTSALNNALDTDKEILELLSLLAVGATAGDDAATVGDTLGFVKGGSTYIATTDAAAAAATAAANSIKLVGVTTDKLVIDSSNDRDLTLA